MNTLLFKQYTAKLLYAVAAITFILTFAFWADFFVAQAARTGIEILSISGTSTVSAGEKLPLKVRLTDDGAGRPSARVSLSDNGGGGTFSKGTVAGRCGDDLSPAEFTVASGTKNKGFCYYNDTSGTYTITAALRVDGSSSTDETSFVVQVVGNGNGSTTNSGSENTTNQNKSGNDTITIVADKIICLDEADLPNYGSDGPNITADTAANWVAEHDSCELVENWEFQWAPRGTDDPGDALIGPAGDPWVADRQVPYGSGRY